MIVRTRLLILELNAVVVENDPSIVIDKELIDPHVTLNTQFWAWLVESTSQLFKDSCHLVLNLWFYPFQLLYFVLLDVRVFLVFRFLTFSESKFFNGLRHRFDQFTELAVCLHCIKWYFAWLMLWLWLRLRFRRLVLFLLSNWFLLFLWFKRLFGFGMLFFCHLISLWRMFYDN